MRVDINKILSEQNRSIYWLSKQINCDFKSLQRLVNNETSSISFSLLEDICICLSCKPNDIFIIEE